MDIFFEILGYIGSLLVVVSLLMTSIAKLRIVSAIGALISGTYAVAISSIPMIVMNVCLVIINVYFLIKLFRPEKHYDLIRSKAEDSFVQYFIKRYCEDIKANFPYFDPKETGDCTYLVCCNGAPAGLFMGRYKADGQVDVIVDYSTPTYRDCSVATFLYESLPKEGVRTVTYRREELAEHVRYLKKMGYTRENGVYVKKLHQQ